MANYGTKKHWSVGRRVQIPAYTDLWMRGARFGTIARFIEGKGRYLDPFDPRGASLYVVKMDHSQVKRNIRFIAQDCTLID